VAIAFCVLSVVVLTIIPVIQFHPSVLFQFIDAILKVGSEIHPTVYNESFVSSIYRLFHIIYPDGIAAILSRTVNQVCMVAIIFLTGIVQFIFQRKNTENLLFLCFLTVMVVFSPLVWYHHFTFFIIPILALPQYPIVFKKPEILVGIVLGLLQLQRVVELFWQPGFPTIVVSVFLLIFYTFAFAKTALKGRDANYSNAEIQI
jgi:hypothetical protein